MSLPTKRFDGSYKDIVEDIHEHGRRRIAAGYQRIVFTNGCFDLIHPGHINTLKYAKDVAGKFGAVVVGINDDASVRRLKGEGRPLLDATSRAMILVSLRYVDHVVTFEEDTPYELIRQLRPSVIVKGGDYTPNKVVGNDVSVVSIAPYDSRWSTTDIIKKAKNS